MGGKLMSGQAYRPDGTIIPPQNVQVGCRAAELEVAVKRVKATADALAASAAFLAAAPYVKGATLADCEEAWHAFVMQASTLDRVIGALDPLTAAVREACRAGREE